MFLKASKTWVVDYQFDGRSRRIYKIYSNEIDANKEVQFMLDDLYGGRAKLVDLRVATDDEERQFLRDEHQRNIMCPTCR